MVKRSTSAQPIGHSAQPCPQPIIDLTIFDNDGDDDDDLDGIMYPSILNMLAKLEREYPDLGLTQCGNILTRNRFIYVSQLVKAQAGQQLMDLGILVGQVSVLLDRTERIMRHTQKSKRVY